MSETTDTTEKTEAKEPLVISNETLPANPEDVTRVFFDDYHEGVTGGGLPDDGRPTIFKLDSKTGDLYPLDDKDDITDHLDIVLAFARTYYRKFMNKSVVCTSDNGLEGWDTELKVERKCRPQEVEGGEGCPYSFQIPKKKFPGQGQCSMGLTIQGVAILNDEPVAIEMNLSSSSARAFSKYLKRLKRKSLALRGVITRLSTKHIETTENSWHAAEFAVEGPEVPEKIAKAVSDSIEQARQKAAAVLPQEV